MVDQKISQHRAAEGSDERCHHRVSQGRAPLSQNRKCERFWTLPNATLRDFIALIRAYGAKPIYVILGGLPEIGQNGRLLQYSRQGAEVARQLGVIVLDSQ